MTKLEIRMGLDPKLIVGSSFEISASLVIRVSSFVIQRAADVEL